MLSLDECVSANIPQTPTGCKKKPVPGWTSFIAPFKEDADFWDAVWRSAGRHQDNELHRLAKYTKNKYHRAIKQIKKCETEIRRSNFLSDCLDGKIQNILKEVTKLRGSSPSPANNVDGNDNPSDISRHFKNLYQKIFNVHNDAEEVKVLLDEINASVKQSDTKVVDEITPELVKKVIQNMLSDKNDPMFEFKSNAFKVGIDALATPLCDLIQAFIIHGHIPDIFLVCSLIPIIKNSRASSMSSENYRLIAITSLLLKLFDGILISLYGKSLKPSTLQFGFQSGQSTTMASWTLIETVSYFTCRGGPVYLCLLDLTKAFDRVKLSTLFELLKEKIPPILLRFIIFSYEHQQCSVMWQGSRSDNFTIHNGVRQGSIASPSYFNLYIDQLFQDLKESKLGCTIADNYYGIIGYADDLALLAPSRETLQQMVDKCEAFFSLRGIKISVHTDPLKSKTVCIGFGLKYAPKPLILYGNDIPFVSKHTHLGHVISEDETMRLDLDLKVNQLIGKFHNLRQQIGQQDPLVMMSLVNIYLLSLYGSNLWDLSSIESYRIDTTFNKLVKNVFNIPYDTHRFIVENISGVKHIRSKLVKRFRNFYHQLITCGKSEIIQLVRLKEHDQRSIFGRNCTKVITMTGAHSVFDSNVESLVIYPVPEGEQWKVSLVNELIDSRRGLCDCGLTSQEVSDIINAVCSK